MSMPSCDVGKATPTRFGWGNFGIDNSLAVSGDKRSTPQSRRNLMRTTMGIAHHTKIGPILVSTLIRDDPTGFAYPIETMVLQDNDKELDTDEYDTEEAAVAGHIRMVAKWMAKWLETTSASWDSWDDIPYEIGQL